MRPGADSRLVHMSLVAPRSHHQAGKRSYEEDGEKNSTQQFSSGKKARRLITAARRSSVPSSPAHVPVTPSVIAGLRSLYPSMNEQTISAVLSECGSDIDAAIRKLSQLQLEAERESAMPATQPVQRAASPQLSPLSKPAASVKPQLTSSLQSPVQHGRHADATLHASSPSGTASRHEQQEKQQPVQRPEQQHEQRPEQQHEQATRQQPQPASPAEWVDALVQTMQQAVDVPDARSRAGAALQAFEAAVRATLQAKEPQDALQQSQQQVAALQRDNTILKRAVAIQNSRLQDMAASVQQLACKEAELTEMRNTAQQYHDRIQALEMSNFTLAQHLRQATDTRSMDTGFRDVF